MEVNWHMSKILVTYWSGTGNTKLMAEYIADGIKKEGGEVEIKQVADTKKDEIKNFDTIAFGCPSMGDEVLEESEMEPFFMDIEKEINGKRVGLFGSYDWGDGQWMRDWEERVKNDGAKLVTDGVIANLEPNDEAKSDCEYLASRLVKG